jgi:ribosomal protein S18 acetylase RimI-like enzyme
MPPEAFAAFAIETVADYAHDNALSGRWFTSDIASRARSEFDSLLPQGLQTPNHFFYEVLGEPAGPAVGWLWFAINVACDIRSGYVYNVKIKPEFRGKGHARAALALIEEQARSEGLAGIGLHVFSFNASAHALYRSLGYGITGFNMLKVLN